MSHNEKVLVMNLLLWGNGEKNETIKSLSLTTVQPRLRLLSIQDLVQLGKCVCLISNFILGKYVFFNFSFILGKSVVWQNLYPIGSQ